MIDATAGLTGRFGVSRWAVIKDAFRRRRRRRLWVAAALLAVASVATVSWTNGAIAPLAPDSLTAAEVGTPLGAAITPGRLWVLDCVRNCARAGSSSGELVEVASASGRVLDRFPVADPQALTAGGGALWIAHFPSGNVTRVDPANGHTTATLRLRLPVPIVRDDRSFLPSSISFGDGRVWISSARGWLAEIEPRSARLAAMVPTPSEDNATSADAYGTWVAENLGGLGLISRGTHRLQLQLRRITEDGYRVDVSAVATGGGVVWALGTFTDPDDLTRELGLLVAVDPRDGRVVHRTVLPSVNDSILYGNGALYVADLADRLLQRIGPGYAAHRLSVPRGARQLIAAAHGRLWALTASGRLLAFRAAYSPGA